MAGNGNFCTLNDTAKSPNAKVSEGNLYLPSVSYPSNVLGTMGVKSGKWYFEARCTNNYGAYDSFGVIVSDNYTYKDQVMSSITGSISWGQLESVRNNGTNEGVTTPNLYSTATKIVGCALDLDNNKVYFHGNNTYVNSHNPSTGTGGYSIPAAMQGKHFLPLMGTNAVGAAALRRANFGQDSSFAGDETAQGNADANGFGDFYYAPPTGFLAICSANLPISDDIDPAQTSSNFPSTQFNAIAYTGTGTSQGITGLGFQPDLVWIKQRNGSGHNVLTDSSRGVQKQLEITDTEGGTQPAESTNTDGLTAFGADGFTVGGDAAYSGNTNTYVAWCWRANGGTTSTNTQGTHTCTLQANTAAGFSIMTLANYTSSTGVTIGHGLGKAPTFYIHKSSSSTGNWHVYHQSTGATKALFLNQYSGGSTAVGYWANTEPTSTVLSLGNTFAGTSDGVVYAWTDIEGYSKFGSYTGNNTDNAGPFVYTGFRPRYLVIKGVTESYGWYCFDSARSEHNLVDDQTSWFPGGTEASEPTGARKVDFFNNGFRVMADAASINGDDDTYIFMCWGDVPLKYANAF